MDLAKLTSLSSIYYEETNLDFLRPLPQMFSCGVQMICTQGEALVSTGAQHFSLKPMSELIFGTEVLCIFWIHRQILKSVCYFILNRYF